MSGQHNLHLVSDSTGETMNTVARAALARFDALDVSTHVWSMVKSPSQLDKVIAAIKVQPGPVLFTMVTEGQRDLLEAACRKLKLPCIPLLDPIIGQLAHHYQATPVNEVGRQYVLDKAYFARIAAIEFTMRCDDGQNEHLYDEADVIIVGVSRTSKTPTCGILAQKGIRAANMPLVPNRPIPQAVIGTQNPLVVGLINNPRNLVNIRRARLQHLGQSDSTLYTDEDSIANEVRDARRLFAQHRWPVIDVSRRSIEETAAQIMTLLSQRKLEILSDKEA